MALSPLASGSRRRYREHGPSKGAQVAERSLPAQRAEVGHGAIVREEWKVV